MRLKVKIMEWSTGIPAVTLYRKTAEKIGVHSGDRISVSPVLDHNKEMSAVVNTIEKYIKDGEVAVSSSLVERLGLKDGQFIEIHLAEVSRSLFLIKKKLAGSALSSKEINQIIEDIVGNDLSEAEIALFVSAMYNKGMTKEETLFLIEAILKNGERLKFSQKLVADKHSIGGIPGNRTTPVVVAICVALGLTMPKTSSRAITSAAGTADTVETIAKVDFNMKDLKKIVDKTGGCLVWGGGLGMVPADAKIIKVEKKLKMDPEAQLLASIISKKLAAGSKYVLIDIPYGKTAKVSLLKARRLRKKFISIAESFGIKMHVVLTKAKEPIGNGIGPVLEMIDVLKVLNPKESGPADLTEKSVYLAGEILEMTGKAKRGEGVNLASGALSSGAAFAKFKEIIKAQGGKDMELVTGKFEKNILAKKNGKITFIDNKKVNSLARHAGCPVDKSAGVYLYVHLGDRVKKGDKLVTVYAESKARLNMAVKFHRDFDGIRVG
jgi:putative thymidine phosphorylase